VIAETVVTAGATATATRVMAEIVAIAGVTATATLDRGPEKVWWATPDGATHPNRPPARVIDRPHHVAPTPSWVSRCAVASRIRRNLEHVGWGRRHPAKARQPPPLDARSMS
jgi:hypothetical protein